MRARGIAASPALLGTVWRSTISRELGEPEGKQCHGNCERTATMPPRPRLSSEKQRRHVREEGHPIKRLDVIVHVTSADTYTPSSRRVSVRVPGRTVRNLFTSLPTRDRPGSCIVRPEGPPMIGSGPPSINGGTMPVCPTGVAAC